MYILCCYKEPLGLISPHLVSSSNLVSVFLLRKFTQYPRPNEGEIRVCVIAPSLGIVRVYMVVARNSITLRVRCPREP